MIVSGIAVFIDACVLAINCPAFKGERTGAYADAACRLEPVDAGYPATGFGGRVDNGQVAAGYRYYATLEYGTTAVYRAAHRVSVQVERQTLIGRNIDGVRKVNIPQNLYGFTTLCCCDGFLQRCGIGYRRLRRRSLPAAPSPGALPLAEGLPPLRGQE